MTKTKKIIPIIILILITTISIGCIQPDYAVQPKVTNLFGIPVENLTVGQPYKIEALAIPSGKPVYYAYGEIQTSDFGDDLIFNTGAIGYTAYIIPESARGKTITIIISTDSYRPIPTDYYVNQ